MSRNGGYRLQLSTDCVGTGDEIDEEENVEEADDYLAAYLYLPTHPENLSGSTAPIAGVVHKTIRLQDLYRSEGYPDVYLDFDKENRLIGVEFV